MAYNPASTPGHKLRDEPALATEKDRPALDRIRSAIGGPLDRLRHGLSRLDLVDERLRCAIAGPTPKNPSSAEAAPTNAADMSLADQAKLADILVEQLFALIDRLQQHAG